MTTERKIYAYQIPPERQCSPLEWGDAPENVYIFGNRDFIGIHADVILYAFDGYEYTPRYKGVNA